MAEEERSNNWGDLTKPGTDTKSQAGAPSSPVAPTPAAPAAPVAPAAAPAPAPTTAAAPRTPRTPSIADALIGALIELYKELEIGYTDKSAPRPEVAIKMTGELSFSIDNTTLTLGKGTADGKLNSHQYGPFSRIDDAVKGLREAAKAAHKDNKARSYFDDWAELEDLDA